MVRIFFKVLYLALKSLPFYPGIAFESYIPPTFSERMFLYLVPLKAQIWSQVRMDLIGPLTETPRGNKYIITLTDYFYTYCIALKQALFPSTHRTNGPRLLWLKKISLCTFIAEQDKREI